MDKTMRNFGLLIAVAVLVFLLYKHMQTAPVAGTMTVGGAFSTETDDTAGDASGSLRFNNTRNLVAGNPDY